MNEVVGLLAATIVALSPFMVYFSTEARGYAIAIVFVVASTLALLRAIDSRGRRWWVAYAVFSALAMYSHYTATFPLLAQLLWVLWAVPGVRKAALGANLLSLVLYLPWASGVLDDRASSTIPLVEAFVASGFDERLRALEAWTFGGPYLLPAEFPGAWVVAVGAAGLAVAAVAVGVRWLRNRRPAARIATDHGFALLLYLGLSTPVFELMLDLLGGPSIFGSRNLGSASAGAALAIAALVSSAGAFWGGIAGATVLSAFVVAAASNIGAGAAKPAFDGAARWIDERAQPGDVVVDVFDVRSTPVPLTPLDVYSESDLETFRPSMPVGPPPFLPYTSQPEPPRRLIDQAFAAAGRDGRVFVVGLDDRMVTDGSSLTGIEIGPVGDPGSEIYELPDRRTRSRRPSCPGCATSMCS